LEGDFIKINDWLLPFSWLYGFGVGVRNFLFEIGVLKSRSFDMPIISVGNITVGGSGKTPHVEYLIRLLSDKFRVAVLSRGYKRHSRGFVLADDETPERMIGDEPYQMKKKFPKISVAVDKDRCHGIDMLAENDATKDIDVVLLDDAYQHRYVKPGINILLVDYHRMIIYDKLLPAGRLREPHSHKDRANIVIVTKCPHDIKPMEFRVLIKALNLFPYQHLFFTTLKYSDLMPIFGDKSKTLTAEKYQNHNVLLLTGIASPQQMMLDMQSKCKSITPLAFPDHHDFNQKDVELINNTFASMSEPKIIITTEKDESRIENLEGLSEEVKTNIYTQPVEIEFMQDGELSFNENIIGYVRKNSRNSILAKTKDDHKSANRHNTGNGTRTISFRNN
jgi:tetraacyldisaccharide 4'-kinase